MTAPIPFQLQFVPHLIFFDVEIMLIKLSRLGDDRHALDDLQTMSLEPRAFGRVVGHQSDRRKPEVGKYLRSKYFTVHVKKGKCDWTHIEGTFTMDGANALLVFFLFLDRGEKKTVLTYFPESFQNLVLKMIH